MVKLTGSCNTYQCRNVEQPEFLSGTHIRSHSNTYLVRFNRRDGSVAVRVQDGQFFRHSSRKMSDPELNACRGGCKTRKRFQYSKSTCDCNVCVITWLFNTPGRRAGLMCNSLLNTNARTIAVTSRTPVSSVHACGHQISSRNPYRAAWMINCVADELAATVPTPPPAVGFPGSGVEAVRWFADDGGSHGAAWAMG